MKMKMATTINTGKLERLFNLDGTLYKLAKKLAYLNRLLRMLKEKVDL